MGYTVSDANSELKKIISGDSPATKEKLQRIINKLDITDNYASANAKTVLYSGYDVEQERGQTLNPKIF